MAYIQSFRACLLRQKLRRLYFFCSFLNFNQAKIESLAFAMRLRQKCLASRNKKEFPKIASQIFGKFRLISEDAAFVSPFIRF